MKLGLGAYSGGGHIYSALQQINSRVILLADTALDMASQFDNLCLVIGRVSLQHDVTGIFSRFARQPLGNTIEEATSIGIELADTLVWFNPNIKVWQLYNESVAADDIEGYRKLAALELAATRRLHQHGRKSCVINFGVAVGDPTHYPLYFSELLAEADYLGIHACGPPDLQLMQHNTEHFALRYRRIVDALHRAGKRCPPIILTECTTYYPWHGTNLSIEDITKDLIWLGDQMMQDRYIVGCCAFQIGSPDHDNFGGFNILDDFLLTRLGAYNSSHTPQFYTDANTGGMPPTSPVQVELPMTIYPTAYIGNKFAVRDLRKLVPRVAQFPRRNLANVKYIVIHHGGVSGDYTSESVAKYHIDNNGWPSIGYHFVLHPDGNIDWVSDLDRASYNVYGRNDEVIGILYCGDFTKVAPIEIMLQRGHSLNAEIQYTFGWYVPVVGHRDIALPASPTSCPGDTWSQWKHRVAVDNPQSYRASEPSNKFVLGFKELANMLGPNVVGEPLENEHTGIFTVQKTSKGLMVWKEGQEAKFYRS